MMYDIGMRSIQRLEDLLADAWESYQAIPAFPVRTLDFYETLDFEGVS